jgi:ribosomal protein L20A (L18A)
MEEKKQSMKFIVEADNDEDFNDKLKGILDGISAAFPHGVQFTNIRIKDVEETEEEENHGTETEKA